MRSNGFISVAYSINIHYLPDSIELIKLANKHNSSVTTRLHRFCEHNIPSINTYGYTSSDDKLSFTSDKHLLEFDLQLIEAKIMEDFPGYMRKYPTCIIDPANPYFTF